ncbi:MULTISPECIES: DNA-processing protein DprA [Thermodesulfovibrio]|jgi:DNA processing protein|uniref:DNA-processing protein DprA n=1 Tax=Thermodesulfovibrio TaxID=28261 RepID=UPI00261735AF|nr:DNA-processing protein DprA [Thermodesulfovibrio sp.]
MNEEEKKFALALNEIQDVGIVSIKKLLSKFGSFRNIFNADIDAISSVEGVGIERARRIRNFNEWNKIEKLIEECEKKDIRIYTLMDKDYPKNLREIYDPPVVLFCRGEIIPEDKFGIAVVGSRKMTEYGRRVTEKIAAELALMGICIVSGLARGIDSTAHGAALDRNGRTVAVLGSGVCNIYPPENKRLADRIIQRGAIISEFHPYEPPKKENFPRRNRIISGMTIGTVVTEATLNSGALITSSFALEQGREVFAVPGNITSKNSEGTNYLIKKGAKLVSSVEDILEEIMPFIPSLKDTIKEQKAAPAVILKEDEKAVFDILEEPLNLDEILIKTGLNISNLVDIILKLEIKGLIIKREGRYIRRN